jgi:hypothetical protein
MIAEEEYYFLYKPIRIANQGGVFPKITDPKVNLGLGMVEEYFIGKTSDPDAVQPIENYIVSFIPKEIAEGLKFIKCKNDKLSEIDDTGMIKERDMTDEEKYVRDLALKFMKKIKTRNSIRTFMDVLDMIADINKKLEITEMICMTLADFIKNKYEDELPNNIKNMVDYISLYNQKLNGKSLILRINVDPDPVNMYERILDKSSYVNKAIKSLYLDK